MAERKKIVFRCDASTQIGSGHVMRCLTLANSLFELGAEVTFICRDHPGHLFGIIESAGHGLIRLAASTTVAEGRLAHSHWLGATQAEDANQTLEALGGIGLVEWIIVDHYALDAEWETAMRSATNQILVIDDLADRKHDCNLLLDQNLGRKAEDYSVLVSTGCKVLVGPQFALLRPEFSARRQYSLNRRATPQMKHLLITMGGVDKDNTTGNILSTLRRCLLSTDSRITVVMGLRAPWLSKVRDQASQMPWKTDVLVNVNNMAELMADSDLAIGAAGSTLWEFCCMGLPALLVVLADNQKNSCIEMVMIGAAESIGTPEAIHDRLPTILQKLSNNIKKIEQFSHAAEKICDGSGANFVSHKLMSL